MKIKTDPPELYLSVICLEKDCRWSRVCANHETAGDFRTEGGSRPLLTLRSGEVYCKTFHSRGNGYDPHEQPVDVGERNTPYKMWDNNCVLWSELEEEVDKYEI